MTGVTLLAKRSQWRSANESYNSASLTIKRRTFLTFGQWVLGFRYRTMGKQGFSMSCKRPTDSIVADHAVTGQIAAV